MRNGRPWQLRGDDIINSARQERSGEARLWEELKFALIRSAVSALKSKAEISELAFMRCPIDLS
jgi:hypothetical protein